FQAEDGIRDLTVTGVQTCALPIFSFSCCVRFMRPAGMRHSFASRSNSTHSALRSSPGRTLADASSLAKKLGAPPARLTNSLANRSEERRVGKECSYRWRRAHEKKT